MVKNPVKVYARLKNNQLLNEVYSIRRKDNYDVLTLNKYAKQRNKYRFHKIFDQNSSQEDVFEKTTKSIVNSVLHGFNGTVFAYGQTGSGKTYSMTGCSDEYENRGIIPRCIQEIFQFTNKSPNQYTIFISYMEIYNEIGYDLLNPKHQATKLEELPRVTLLDDGKGEAHLRNLFTLPVMTEQEAMRLLFLGDTNRTIAETPMNDYSSRSHCIFTIYITRTENERKIRKSKLNLVDLAGSERIYKTNISGATLTEAKNINLSLHYLEQVILALSQSKRSHIPFRNSMMTYMLRDSLAGNSITVMLATLAIRASNLEETATTCNFSQRVAMVNTDATINEIFDPQEEIDHLRNEVTNLRKKLTSPNNTLPAGEKVLSESEIAFCDEFTSKYLKTGVWNNNITLNMQQCIQCFQTFRNIIIKREENSQIKQDIDEYSYAKSDIVDKFKEIIKQKDEEIDILTQLLEAYDLSKNTNLTNTDENKHIEEYEMQEIPLSVNDADLFDEFLNEKDNSAQLQNYKTQIESKCRNAEQISAFVESCQQNILRLRRKLEMGFGITDSSYLTQIQNSLKSQQDVYAKSIENLKTIKEETDFLEHGLKQERIRLERTFFIQRRDKYKVSGGNKGSSDNGLFARINESLRNIERKFSGKVKQQQQAKIASPKKCANNNEPQENRFIKIKKNTLKITNTNKDKIAIKNTYTPPDRHISSSEVFVADSSSKKSIIKQSISAAKMDMLKKQRNDLYRYKSEQNVNNEPQIVDETNACYSRLTPNVEPKPLVDEHSDNDSDLIFERKIQSYLKKVPANPKKDTHANDGNDRRCIDNNTESCKNYKNSVELGNASVNHLRMLNRMTSNRFANDSSTIEENVEDSSAANANKLKKMAEVYSNSSGEEYGDEVKVLPQRNRLCDRYSSSDRLDMKNYDDNSLYNDILQEEHIPVKDFTVSQRSSSSDEQLQTKKCKKSNEDNRDVFAKADTEEFVEFMQTIPLTGDDDVDEEIVKFYRTKFIQ